MRGREARRAMRDVDPQPRPSAVLLLLVFAVIPSYAIDHESSCDTLLSFYNLVPALVRTATHSVCEEKKDCELLTLLVTNDARKALSATRKELACTVQKDVNLPAACLRLDALPEKATAVIKKALSKTPHSRFGARFAHLVMARLELTAAEVQAELGCFRDST